jgi:hypothetical protein
MSSAVSVLISSETAMTSSDPRPGARCDAVEGGAGPEPEINVGTVVHDPRRFHGITIRSTQVPVTRMFSPGPACFKAFATVCPLLQSTLWVSSSASAELAVAMNG